MNGWEMRSSLRCPSCPASMGTFRSRTKVRVPTCRRVLPLPPFRLDVFQAETGRPRLLLVTSALPDEGKSTIAANLAYTLAQGGARVLLVDADLRRGALHKLLGLKQEPGLSHLLQHASDGDRVFQTNSLPNLAFLACGSRMNNPGDRFLGAALDKLLVRWRAEFDYVIIDSSPIFAADDASTLAPKMDDACLVVRSRFSNARQVRERLNA